MWDKFTESFWDNIWWIMLALLFVFVALAFYGAGVQATKDKVCNQIGGVYVQTWNGHKCIHATEIDL